MSNEKFTKGPWSIDESCTTFLNVRAKDKHSICEVDCLIDADEYGFFISPDDEEKANASLIVAAPEMYEALKPFANYACGCGKCNNCIAKNILAKARGER